MNSILWTLEVLIFYLISIVPNNDVVVNCFFATTRTVRNNNNKISHHYTHYYNLQKNYHSSDVKRIGYNNANNYRRTKSYLLSSTINNKQSTSSSYRINNENNNNNVNTKKINTNNNNNDLNVIFQKVIHPPNNIPNNIYFLSHLIEYLQEKFIIPIDKLSMLYEKKIYDYTQDQEQEHNSNDQERYTIVQIDSPLSPSSLHTCLNVQVIGIYPNDDDDDDNQSKTITIPSMAMVIVGKKQCNDSNKQQQNMIPQMLHGLFLDSEKKIIKHLDKCLNDFVDGKIPYNDNHNNHNRNNSKENYQKNNEEILSEIMYDDDEIYNEFGQLQQKQKTTATTITSSSSTIDAEIVTNNNDNTKVNNNNPMVDHEQEKIEKKEYDKQRRDAVLKTMQQPSTATGTSSLMSSIITPTHNDDSSNSKPPGLEFAIQAAKQAMEKRRIRQQQQEIYQQELSSNSLQEQHDLTKDVKNNQLTTDFAVRAAIQKVANTKLQKTDSKESSMKVNKKGSKKSSSSSSSSIPIDEMILNMESNETKSQKSNNNVITMEQQIIPNRSPMLDNMMNSKRAFMTTISSPEQYQQKQQRKNVTTSTITPQSTQNQEKSVTNPIVNMNKSKTAIPSSNKNPTVNKSKDTMTKNPIDYEFKTLVQNEQVDDNSSKDDTTLLINNIQEEILNEIADSGKDLTPEELLEDILVFDKQSNYEKSSGFAIGAYDKAKDIIREQQQQQQNTNPSNKKSNKSVRELTQDEELRKMFQAGERIAESRIDIVSTSSYVSDQSIQDTSNRMTREDDIESLINSDKTISKHARILDDELIELQLRIMKSPDEEFDGPEKNPLFDIFSGPEVYNRNVDPETSINWPGVRRGTTTNIRLPKELDIAIQQAKFAAEVLFSVKEEILDNGMASYHVGNRTLSSQQMRNLYQVVNDAVTIGLIDNPLDILAEKGRLQMLLDELQTQPKERYREIMTSFKDLLLSDYFVPLIKVHLKEMADKDLNALRNDDTSLEQIHLKEREVLGQIVLYAQLLLKEVKALGSELEVHQLEIIRSICKVAMDPSYQTEEEAAMALTDAVRDMRPLLDDTFVAYIKYAVVEEEGKLARNGLLHDPEHNQWLHVLKIVQQGVYNELAKGINRYIEHIWYILRMETPIERRRLLEELISVMPTLDVRPFIHVVQNIVGSLGDSTQGNFNDGIIPLGEMTNKLLQLHRDMNELLPKERVDIMSKDADEWIAKQKQRLLDQRNLTKQRLKASQDTEHLDNTIEELCRRGEVDRFD